MKITEFFNNDYVNYASYDNLRKIASVVDGQKNASRKILYTILEKNIRTEIKVSQLGSKVAEFSEYLHGNLDGVIVGLAQDYAGTNNIPLLVREGNFGTRFAHDASAARYIYTNGSKEFFELFNKDDVPVLKSQYFEGHQIEPMFYVPNLPILLINGSEGVSSGFAQKIIPRDKEKIKNYIKGFLSGSKSRYKFEPFYEGFKGTVEQGDNPAQWLIKGIVKKIGVNKVEISEVPVGYNLKGYINVLDDLEDKKIIQSYRDKSEDDNFKFQVNISSKSLKDLSEEQLLIKLKLVKKITENYTVIDENNKIKVYDSAKDILDHYIKVKLDYMAKRKIFQSEKIEASIVLDFSKYTFIKLIVDEELKINKRKKDQIVADLSKVVNIIKRDDSYDYLLNMPIHSLTKERMDKLLQDIKDKQASLRLLKKTKPQDMWINEM
jgi:DNA gyrase/topoisomerase IV subunit A